MRKSFTFFIPLGHFCLGFFNHCFNFHFNVFLPEKEKTLQTIRESLIFPTSFPVRMTSLILPTYFRAISLDEAIAGGSWQNRRRNSCRKNTSEPGGTREAIRKLDGWNTKITYRFSWLAMDSRSLTMVFCGSVGWMVDVADTVDVVAFLLPNKLLNILLFIYSNETVKSEWKMVTKATLLSLFDGEWILFVFSLWKGRRSEEG